MQRENYLWIRFWILITGCVLLLGLTIGMQEAGLTKASAAMFTAASGWMLISLLSLPPLYCASQNAARQLLNSLGKVVEG